jgi:alanine racemase/UDP-N-acetylmuramoyl-tripeptide--D-alanyl-D-alanine ligase
MGEKMDDFDLRLWNGFKEAGGNPSAPALINQVAIDSRMIDSNLSLFVALPGKQTNGHRFVAASGARYAIVGRDYVHEGKDPITLLYVDDPLRALQEIAKTYRNEPPTKIIAITGSYGKTMVKDLLYELVKDHIPCQASPESFNSQIGVPLSIFTISKEHKLAIMEAAISEKNEMEKIAEMLRPDFGIMTRVGKKHIDRLGNVETLVSELLKLYQNDTLKWLSLPDTSEIKKMTKELSVDHYFWNQNTPGTPHAERLSEHDGLSIPYRITFPDAKNYQGQITSGFHYYLDLLNMAIKAAFQLGVTSEIIGQVLENYTLEPIRKEIWKSPLGVTFINDSYAEDPISLDHALKFLNAHSGEGKKIFIFEGLKGNKPDEDYKRIGNIICNHSLDMLFLIGEHHFEPLISSLSSSSISIVKATSLNEAFKLYKVSMHSGDTVLIKGTKKEPIENLIGTFHESITSSLCQINLAAIEHNIKILRNKLPAHTRMMVMVKAFAYGTDAFRIARFLTSCGIDIIGVSYVEEGVALKKAGISQSVFVLNAADYEVKQLVKWDLEIGVSSKDFIEHLAKEAADQNKCIKVHLHIDTGMSRFGCRKEEALDLAKFILNQPSLELEGVMTHFASADDVSEDTFTLSQAADLNAVISELKKEGIDPKWKHAANSAGVLRFSFPEFNMVRVALAIYGLQPSVEKEKNHLRLAVSLFSRIAGINHCKKGDTISYGRSYLVEEEEMQVAVIPVGYFDGLHRNYSGKGSVLIRGKKAPMIGKICMDFMMIDVTHIPEAKVGDPVLIFGEDDHGHYLSPEELALQGNSISHELITCLGPRIQRFFIYEESHQKEPLPCLNPQN